MFCAFAGANNKMSAKATSSIESLRVGMVWHLAFGVHLYYAGRQGRGASGDCGAGGGEIKPAGGFTP